MLKKRNSNYYTFYESQGFPTVKPLLSEKDKPQTLCCLPSLLNVLSIRRFLSRINCSTPVLPLPHLDQLMHISGVFAGQASCACSRSQPWAQPGLQWFTLSGSYCQVSQSGSHWLALLEVPMERQWEGGSKPPPMYISSNPLTITPPQDQTPTQTKQDVPGNLWGFAKLLH